MISPRKFAQDYASFWHTLLPMAEALVRTINKDYERYVYEKELAFASDAGRRGILNEAAFELAKNEWLTKHEASDSELMAVFGIAAESIRRIDPKSPTQEPTEAERDEIRFISRRLRRYCSLQPNWEVSFSPVVPGCGFVDESTADLLVGSELCEVKAGDRTFRVVDLRQLFTYAALLHLEGSREIDVLTLVNPRRGIYYSASADDICLSAAGAPAEACFAKMAAFFSGAFNSV